MFKINGYSVMTIENRDDLNYSLGPHNSKF